MAKQATPSPFPEVISFADTCAALGVSRRKGERLISNHKSDFPRPFKIGGERFFRAETVRAWINAKANAANPDAPASPSEDQPQANAA